MKIGRLIGYLTGWRGVLVGGGMIILAAWLAARIHAEGET